jgi:hypothetical protein
MKGAGKAPKPMKAVPDRQKPDEESPENQLGLMSFRAGGRDNKMFATET